MTYRIFSVLIGAFLLAAAGLKLWGPADGPLGQNAAPFSPRFQFAAAEVEALVGLWLLSGRARRAAWLTALVLFGLFAGVSLYLGLAGRSSCGCFGRIPVSPWWTFALDATCLAVLGVCRPRPEATPAARWVRESALVLGGGGTVLASVLGLVVLTGGRPDDILARLRGEPVAVGPEVTDIGEGQSGESRTITVQVRNRSDRPIRLVGGTADCSCVTTADLPVSIPPGESRPVGVHVRFTGTPGLFQHQFAFYTDALQQPRVTARFKGRIVSSSGP